MKSDPGSVQKTSLEEDFDDLAKKNYYFPAYANINRTSSAALRKTEKGKLRE
jgi:hypothetical protein